MTPQERERMNLLSVRIQEEKDPRRFESLLQELSTLIKQKELRFPHREDIPTLRQQKASKTVSGVVQKIVKDVYANQAERVEILIPEAEELFREIRIVNIFTDDAGQTVALKQGVDVDVTFEADAKDTVKVGRGAA
jgi:hypothetical protein